MSFISSGLWMVDFNSWCCIINNKKKSYDFWSSYFVFMCLLLTITVVRIPNLAALHMVRHQHMSAMTTESKVQL